MQEEISNQIVVILKNAGGLTAQALKQAIIKAVIEPENRRAALRQSRRTAAENERLRQRMRQRERQQNQRNRPHGRMKVKELVAQGKGVKSFEISSDSKSKFITNANKMGVDFAVETAENGNTMVFYKPNDIEIITAVQQHTMGKAWSKSAPENEVLSGIGIGMNDFKRVKKAFDEAKIPCHGVREQNSIMLLYPREHDDAVLKIMEKHYTAERGKIGDVTKDAVLEKVPVNGENIGDFTQIARRYKVEFTPYKVQNEDKYLVFFRSEKREQIHAAFRAYTKDMRRREHDKTDQRVPLEVRLRHSRKIIKEQNKQKIRNKEHKAPQR